MPKSLALYPEVPQKQMRVLLLNPALSEYPVDGMQFCQMGNFHLRLEFRHLYKQLSGHLQAFPGAKCMLNLGAALVVLYTSEVPCRSIR